MEVIPVLDVVTVDDLVRAGACREGVIEVRDRLFSSSTAVRVSEIPRRRLSKEQLKWLDKACGSSGSGSGENKNPQTPKTPFIY